MSFAGKKLKNVFKDMLQIDNSNTGLGTDTKKVVCGDGDPSSLWLSKGNLIVRPDADNTSVLQVQDDDGNFILRVDTTNDLIMLGAGQHYANTSIKEFGLWDFSPTAGEHHNLTTSPTITTTSDDDFSGEVNGGAWGGTGTNPATSLTISSSAKELVAGLWILQANITIDEIYYVMSSDAASTINLHVMQYDIVAGAGSTAGDLTNGVVLAQTGSDASSLSPITTGADRVSNGTLTINTANVNDGEAIVCFAEASDTDDMTLQLNIKYHLR